MNLAEVKKLDVGTVVSDLDVVISTAGRLKKNSNGKWEQGVRVADTVDNMLCLVTMPRNIPLIRGNPVRINSATIATFENKQKQKEKRLDVTDFELDACTADEYMAEKETQRIKNQGILDPMIAKILEKYEIAATDALWAFKRGNTTTWIILHRYCEQIAAKANVTFDKPELIYGGPDSNEVVLLVTGYLGYIREWSYGEASPDNNKNPYPYAMAEKRAKDRVILKLAGVHGLVYSESEEEWNNHKKRGDSK
ncbi:MAG: hypothetical protein ACYSSI_00260 [Planctomycetota bacterium]|jgi:hypothetical protein